jgi:hypothetical protein
MFCIGGLYLIIRRVTRGPLEALHTNGMSDAEPASVQATTGDR